MLRLLLDVEANWLGSKSCIACTWLGSDGKADRGELGENGILGAVEVEVDGPAC